MLSCPSLYGFKKGLIRTLAAMGMCAVLFPAQSFAIPRTEKALREIIDELTKTAVPYGAIPAIHQPSYVKAADAALSMDAREPVFIVFLPGGPRIYPQKLMVWHEVVNDYINGQGYSITYSPISGCVAAYKSTLLGITLILENEGRLFNNNSVLIDRNTGSLWLQILGMAFDGPLTGKGLEYVPTWWTDWGHARKAYPKALVLATPRAEKKPYGRDPYGSYITPNNYYDDERIMFPLMHRDNRLHPKARILGIEYEKQLIAIDEKYVRQKGVVNFYMGATPLVAILDPRLNVVRVFERKIWDTDALFTPDQKGIIDIDTRSVWNYDGKAIAGNLKGASLDEMLGINAFWFAWATFHPETLLVPGPSVVPDSALVKGGDIKSK